jgi:hypothetical protein
MCSGISLPCVNISARQRIVVRFDKKRTAKAVYRAKRCRVLFAVHGKVFAVRFLFFAMRPRRMAKAVFPVVSRGDTLLQCRLQLEPKDQRNQPTSEPYFCPSRIPLGGLRSGQSELTGTESL